MIDFDNLKTRLKALQVFMTDCEGDDVSREDFETMANMKIGGIKHMMQLGFIPVKCHEDGRMVFEKVEFEEGSKGYRFYQLHASRKSAHDWTISCYPVPTADGLPMMSLEEQKRYFEGDPNLMMVEKEMTDEGCNCPNCVARKMGEYSEEAKAEFDKRTLH